MENRSKNISPIKEVINRLMASLAQGPGALDVQGSAEKQDDDEDDDDFEVDDDDLPLQTLFTEARAIFSRVTSEDYSPSSDLTGSVDPVTRGLLLLDKIASRVRSEGLFSANEELDDVPTDSLPLLLVEHYRARLLPLANAAAGTGGAFDPAARLSALKRSRTSHIAFLVQVDTLGGILQGSDKELFDASQFKVFDASPPKKKGGGGKGYGQEGDDGDEDEDGESGRSEFGKSPAGGGVVRYSGGGGAGERLGSGASDGGGRGGGKGLEPGRQRENKMERFRLQRDLKKRLAALEAQLGSAKSGCGGGSGGGGASSDEVVVRERHVLSLRCGASISLDEVEAAGLELQMLTMRLSRASAALDPSSAACGGSGSGGGLQHEREDKRVSSRGGGGAYGQGSEPIGGVGGGNSGGVYHPSDPQRPGLAVTHMNLDPTSGQLVSRRETVKAGALFVPGHNLPTMTLEELAEIEVAEAMERQAKQASAGPRDNRRMKQLEEDGDEDDARLADQAAEHDRKWDDFKDDNKKGSGNKANKRFGC